MVTRIRSVLVLMSAALFASAALVTAADALPDVIGIRPGMSVGDATRALQEHDPKGTLTIGSMSIAQIGNKPATSLLHLRGGGAGAEIVQVHIAPPPGAPVVWAVARQLRFAQGEEMLQGNLINALRQKYGEETVTIEANGRLYWFFDDHGVPIADVAGLKARGCLVFTWGEDVITDSFVTRSVEMRSQVLSPRPQMPPCDSFVTVKATLQPAFGAASGAIRMMTVSVADGALALRARQATMSAIAAADATKQQQEREKAGRRPVPKL